MDKESFIELALKIFSELGVDNKWLK
jgi:hypothetical protein